MWVWCGGGLLCCECVIVVGWLCMVVGVGMKLCVVVGLFVCVILVWWIVEMFG